MQMSECILRECWIVSRVNLYIENYSYIELAVV